MRAPKASALFAALLLAFGIQAWGATATSTQNDELRSDEVHHANGIDYVSGGVGADALQDLRQFAAEHGYNMKLVFTLNAGNYLADVNVVVKDQRGRTLIDDVADGPLLVAKVPPGTYSVAVRYNGRTETRTMRVGHGGMQTAYFRWPAGPDDFTFAAAAARARTSSGGGNPESAR